MELNKQDIAQRIKKIRVDRNETMEQFAEKIESGKSNVSKWERGKNIPNEITLRKIADLGSISVEELKYGSEKDYINDIIFDYAKNNVNFGAISSFPLDAVNRKFNSKYRGTAPVYEVSDDIIIDYYKKFINSNEFSELEESYNILENEQHSIELQELRENRKLTDEEKDQVKQLEEDKKQLIDKIITKNLTSKNNAISFINDRLKLVYDLKRRIAFSENESKKLEKELNSENEYYISSQINQYRQAIDLDEKIIDTINANNGYNIYIMQKAFYVLVNKAFLTIDDLKFDINRFDSIGVTRYSNNDTNILYFKKIESKEQILDVITKYHDYNVSISLIPRKDILMVADYSQQVI